VFVLYIYFFYCFPSLRIRNYELNNSGILSVKVLCSWSWRDLYFIQDNSWRFYFRWGWRDLQLFLNLMPVAIGFVCVCVCVYWNLICFFVGDRQIQKPERIIALSIICDLRCSILTEELSPIAYSPYTLIFPTILFLKIFHAY